MAGIPFLHNIDLNNNELLNAKLHTSTSAPSSPGIGTIWYDSTNDLVKLYDNTATGNVSGWNTISGDITAVTSATTNQLTVANSGGPAPAFSIVTGAIADGGTGLATADQIHTFVTGASTSGTAAIATTITVADESTDATCFPLFSTAATGNLGPKSGSNLTFNSATGNLSATLLTGTLQTAVQDSIDRIFNSDLVIGAGATDAYISFMNDNAVVFKIDGDSQVELVDGIFRPATDSDVDLGQSAIRWKDAWVDSITVTGTATAAAFSGPLTGNVTGNASGTAATVTGATQAAITTTANLVTVGALDSGSITSGFGNINNGSSTLTTGAATVASLVVSGNLTVNGTTTDVDTTNLVVEDPLIKLAKLNASADSVDIGFYGLCDPTGSQDTYTGLFRDATDEKYKLFHRLQAEPNTTVNTSGTGYAVPTLVATLEGNVTGNVTGSSGSTTGNAATATALATGRTIGMTGDVVWTSPSFDGSGNVTAVATIQANSVTLGTDTTGDYVSTITATTNGGITTTGATSGEGVAHALAVDFASGAQTITGTQYKVVTANNLSARSISATIDKDDSTFAGTPYKASIEHGLATEDVIVQLFDSVTKATVYADVVRKNFAGTNSTNKVTVTFASVPTNDIEVLITSIKGASAGTVSYA